MLKPFVNVGAGNLLDTRRLCAILPYGSAPSMRLLRKHKEGGTYLDATGGKTLRSLVLLDTASVVGSHLTAPLIARRAEIGGEYRADAGSEEDREEQQEEE